MLGLIKGAALAVFTVAALQGSATAQTRCEPTISQPCNQPAPAKPQQPRTNAAPAANTTNSLSNTLREPVSPPREKTRLDPVPVFPEIKLDKDTSMGIGQGGGIIGLERKF